MINHSGLIGLPAFPILEYFFNLGFKFSCSEAEKVSENIDYFVLRGEDD